MAPGSAETSGVADFDAPSAILFLLLNNTIFRNASSFAISFDIGGSVIGSGDATSDGGYIGDVDTVEVVDGSGAGTDIG